MKGILKGFIFTFIMLSILVATLAGIFVIVDIPEFVLKAILWSIICFCVFSGSVLVARGAESRKSIKGIVSALLSVIALFITVCILGNSIPTTGSFYALATIIVICGMVGAFTGSRA